jgi:Flp pilus assembly protein TadG
MALIMPTLVLILIGIFESGMAFRDYLTASFAAREGARLVAFMGTRIDADCVTVTTMASNMTPTDFARLQEIQIFKSNTNGTQGLTNTFRFTGLDPLNCDHWSQNITWPSPSRQTTVGPGLTLDIVGVRVISNHEWVTGFPPFRGSFTINENTIVRIEPEEFA